MTNEIPPKNIEEEYKQFAYIVSHDLKAPLRHIKQFTNLLIEARPDKLSNEEEQYIFYIKQALLKLDKMQEALLKFSRVNTHNAPFEKMDTSLLIDCALSSLEIEVHTANAEITKETLPEIVADKNQMQTVFYELLQNALLYSDDKNPITIEITGEQTDTETIIEIKDNGNGIPEDLQDAAFSFFRRLKPSDTIPGAGAGLAIAKKIIERHEGKIWIESDGKSGTAIKFSLPRNAKDPMSVPG